jgi:hypothetical protein
MCLGRSATVVAEVESPNERGFNFLQQKSPDARPTGQHKQRKINKKNTNGADGII